MAGKDRIFEAEDRRIARHVLSSRETLDLRRGGGDLPARLGLLFLGAPYQAAPLEGEDAGEPLVISLRAFDCFTFVESVTALSLSIRGGDASADAFARQLEQLRYRRGLRTGWASRLHYFTDWIGDNSRLGLVRDMTREMGGRPCTKRIGFMTDHPEIYPRLADTTVRAELRRAERNLSRRRRFCLPTEGIRKAESWIREGDLVGLTAAADGLDVVHTGLAISRHGRMHLLHASRPAGGVSVADEPLARYVADRPDATGIVVARLTTAVLR